MKIAEVLRAWRCHSELSINEASELIGVPWDTYKRVERGHPMHLSTFWAILTWMMGD